MDRGEIIIYQTADGETRLDVRMENDSVWLTQAQIAHLFGVDRTVIVRHVNNIYKSSELERDVTCAKIAHVQHEGQRQVRRMIPFYNLDMILSVGYRVNSKNATQFRIWANKVLKEYLIKGYAVNSQAKAEQLEELKQTVHLLSNVLSAKDVTKSEAIGLLRVITDYTYGLDTLDRYDISSWKCRLLRPRSRFMRPMKMRWRRYRCYATSSEAASCSPTRRTSRSKARWAQFTRLSAGGTSIRALRRRRLICSI